MADANIVPFAAQTTRFRRKPIRAAVRFAVLTRDKFTCQYCGAGPETKLHVDHVQPLAWQGTDDFENLLTACRDCNLGKSDAHIWDTILAPVYALSFILKHPLPSNVRSILVRVGLRRGFPALNQWCYHYVIETLALRLYERPDWLPQEAIPWEEVLTDLRHFHNGTRRPEDDE